MPGRKVEKAQGNPNLQPPEAGEQMPHPEDQGPFTEQAVTIPTIPGRGAPPAALPTPTKPAMHPPTRGFDPTTVQKKRTTQLDSVITLYPPLIGKTSTLGTGLIGECALANGLGNQEPPKVHVGFSDDNTQVFLLPVGPLANRSVEVSYYSGTAVISLWQAFQESGGKVVENGYREQYNLWRTDEPVTIHGTTGYAVFFSMEDRDKARINSRETMASGVASKSKKATAAKGKGTVNAGEPSADPTLWEDVYADIIAERDDKIKELEKRLKEYETKFGRL